MSYFKEGEYWHLVLVFSTSITLWICFHFDSSTFLSKMQIKSTMFLTTRLSGASPRASHAGQSRARCLLNKWCHNLLNHFCHHRESWLHDEVNKSCRIQYICQINIHSAPSNNTRKSLDVFKLHRLRQDYCVGFCYGQRIYKYFPCFTVFD